LCQTVSVTARISIKSSARIDPFDFAVKIGKLSGNRELKFQLSGLK
jgi:hypothetical protein